MKSLTPRWRSLTWNRWGGTDSRFQQHSPRRREGKERDWEWENERVVWWNVWRVDACVLVTQSEEQWLGYWFNSQTEFRSHSTIVFSSLWSDFEWTALKGLFKCAQVHTASYWMHTLTGMCRIVSPLCKPHKNVLCESRETTDIHQQHAIVLINMSVNTHTHRCLVSHFTSAVWGHVTMISCSSAPTLMNTTTVSLNTYT